jgi:hypothetical protein
MSIWTSSCWTNAVSATAWFTSATPPGPEETGTLPGRSSRTPRKCQAYCEREVDESSGRAVSHELPHCACATYRQAAADIAEGQRPIAKSGWPLQSLGMLNLSVRSLGWSRRVPPHHRAPLSPEPAAPPQPFSGRSARRPWSRTRRSPQPSSIRRCTINSAASFDPASQADSRPSPAVVRWTGPRQRLRRRPVSVRGVQALHDGGGEVLLGLVGECPDDAFGGGLLLFGGVQAMHHGRAQLSLLG